MSSEKFRILPKFSFLISCLITLSCSIYSAYKGTILYLVKKAMDDTFVGGETSDLSIGLWFFISGIMLFITFIFFYLRKINDLKSQKIILNSLIIICFILFVAFLLFIPNMFIFSTIPLVILLIYVISYKNLKKEILFEKKNKPLTDKEVYLLQRLAKKK